MALLTIGAFGAGLYYHPPRDDDAPLPPQLRVLFPGRINDGDEKWLFTGMSWTEIHSTAHPELKLARDVVRVIVTLQFAPEDEEFDGSFRQRISPVVAKVDLPDGADYLGCKGMTHPTGSYAANFSTEQFHCQVEPQPAKEAYSVPLTKRILEVNGNIDAGSTAMIFSFDVKGVDGLTVLTNERRAAVRLPLAGPIGLFGPEPTPDDESKIPKKSLLPALPLPLNVSVSDSRPDVQKYTWTPHPRGEVDNFVLWAQPPNLYPDSIILTPILGVRDDLIRQDSYHEFLSGVAFGVGGGAFIGIIQSLFSSWRERRIKKIRVGIEVSQVPVPGEHGPAHPCVHSTGRWGLATQRFRNAVAGVWSTLSSSRGITPRPTPDCSDERQP